MNKSNKHQIKKQFSVSSDSIGLRIDQYLSHKFPEFSRSTVQQWIKQGLVKINGNNTKSKCLLKGFEVIDLDIILNQAVEDEPEDMTLDIRYEDEHLLILNKPAGLVVHPGSGNPTGTLLNGLLGLSEEQKMLNRAGIVHRLDKDTSGLMVVAKTIETQNSLINLLKDHIIRRTYFAIVKGRMYDSGSIDKAIGRHRTMRIKMAVAPHNGKKAITHYKVLENFDHYTAMRVNLETGRTHQIRVHMHHLGHQLLGDPLYGNPKRIEPQVNQQLKTIIRDFPRQALHAQSLEFTHPITAENLLVEAELPEDLASLLYELQDLDLKNNDSLKMTVEYIE
ncbi:MAG: 23S rRNA pseudouridine(1911/1915/1917) synthase RluD [Proteobacteria bacterium]|nr:23S rRNA pseudouridine(1911/1915/1917) synthase RluD [Pseudomonadota bacterium]